MAQWAVEASWGTAAELHDRDLPDPPCRTVWLHQVSGPALVLGSAQKEDQLDLASARADGVEVCRRRSGGGAVLVDPADCWIDLIIPSTDRLWNPDVGHAFLWLGELWVKVLDGLGLGGGEVHRGPPSDRERGKVVCFAGLGSGEVTTAVPGNAARRRKTVGLSQRRTRNAARFQCLVPAGPDLSTIQRYLAVQEIDVTDTPVGSGLAAGVVAGAFLAELSRP